jgi:hypothetical protein
VLVLLCAAGLAAAGAVRLGAQARPVIPTSAFLYASEAPPVLRFCFAKRDETLHAAAEKLRRVSL